MKKELHMKKLFSALMAIIMVWMVFAANAETAVATQEPAKEYDFKTFFWGASKEEVIAVEGTPYEEDEECFRYIREVLGLDVALSYYFDDDGLYQAVYILIETHSNEELYINDYNTFKNALEKKYGEPWYDAEEWQSDSKKEYYADNKGEALRNGALSYFTYWKRDRSDMNMIMFAQNNQIITGVVYCNAMGSLDETDSSGAQEQADFMELWGGARFLDSKSIEHPRLVYVLNGVPGDDMLATYRYENDRLYEVVYGDEARTSSEVTFALWDEMEALLTEQYGEKEAEFRKTHRRPFYVPTVYEKQTNLKEEELDPNHIMTAADRVMTLMDYTQRFVKNKDGSGVYILNRLYYIYMGAGEPAKYTFSTSFTYFDAENAALIEQDLMSE